MSASDDTAARHVDPTPTGEATLGVPSRPPQHRPPAAHNGFAYAGLPGHRVLAGMRTELDRAANQEHSLEPEARQMREQILRISRSHDEHDTRLTTSGHHRRRRSRLYHASESDPVLSASTQGTVSVASSQIWF